MIESDSERFEREFKPYLLVGKRAALDLVDAPIDSKITNIDNGLLDFIYKVAFTGYTQRSRK